MKNAKSIILLTALMTVFFTLTVSAQSNGSKSNVEIVKGLYESFAKGDMPAILASFDPKIEWSEAENFIYGDGKPFVGPDAIVNGVFMKLGTEWEYWNVVNTQFTNMDNGMVLVTGRYQAKYKKNGAVIDAQCAHVWTLKDGKAIRFQQYTDTKQVSEAINK